MVDAMSTLCTPGSCKLEPKFGAEGIEVVVKEDKATEDSVACVVNSQPTVDDLGYGDSHTSRA